MSFLNFVGDVLNSMVKNNMERQVKARRDFLKECEESHPNMSSAARERINYYKEETNRMASRSENPFGSLLHSSSSSYGDSAVSHSRRTDEEARTAPLDWPRSSASCLDTHSASLASAAGHSNVPGVYILRLYGQVMKVGSAEIGVAKRMQQYYAMNASCGLPDINESNRDDIEVEWQDCPRSKCNELESKLFQKYGKGPWAKRSPHSSDNTWELLI